MSADYGVGWQALFANFLKIEEVKKSFLFFADIFLKPTDRTMDIVEKKKQGIVSPYQFMAFGFSVYALTNISTPIFRPDFAFLEAVFLALLFPVVLTVFYAICYKIFQDVAKSNRTFNDYLQMSAITAGMSWILTGISSIVLSLSGPLGLPLLTAVTIYMLVYTMKVWKRFWGMSYGNILLYSFFSLIAFLIVASIIISILVALLS